MRAAPPVSVRGSGGLGWRLLQALLPAVAVAVACVWVLAQLEQPLLWWAAAPAALAGLLAWRFADVADASLAWDGQCFAADGVPGRIDVMMDLGSWLLLRLQPAAGGRRRWLAITAAEAGPALHGLRTALYAQRAERPADSSLPDTGRPR